MNRLSIQMIVVMVVITAISGFVLSFTFNISKAKISKNQKKNITNFSIKRKVLKLG